MYKCLYTHTANAAFLSASLRYSSTMINDFLLQNIIIKNTILPSPPSTAAIPTFYCDMLFTVGAQQSQGGIESASKGKRK